MCDQDFHWKLLCCHYLTIIFDGYGIHQCCSLGDSHAIILSYTAVIIIAESASSGHVYLSIGIYYSGRVQIAV